MPDNKDRVVIENVVSPGRTTRVDAEKYGAMREALIAVLPAGPPGVTISEAKAALLPHLPEHLFPGGDKAGWWLKAVHLDLEAKRLIGRSTRPVRLFRSEAGAAHVRPPAPDR